MALKIPFGKDKETGIFYDAGMVANGKKCNCICDECGTDLQAVHPKNPMWQRHFRHDVQNNCKGGLENLYHKLAKQILQESDSLNISPNTSMSYTSCDIETARHGRRPDAYISDSDVSLIVEIFYSHRIENSTLNIYLAQGERILEIDISAQKDKLPDYQQLKELVLFKAPRNLYPNAENVERKEQKLIKDTNWLRDIFLFVLVVFLLRKISKWLK